MATANRNKDTYALMRRVAKWPGWRVERGRANGGFKVFPPDGQKPFSVSSGPRDPRRQYLNVVAKLRRRGADI